MQPSAHIQSTIECLGILLAAWHDGQALPADVNFERFRKNRRYIGSKDRAAIAARYYHILRHLAIADELAASLPGYQRALPYPCPTSQSEATARALVLAVIVAHHEMPLATITALFDGLPYHPAALQPTEISWLQQLSDRFDEAPINSSTEFWITNNCPAWLRDELAQSLGKRVITELGALQSEAPVDIRANSIKTTRTELQQKLAEEGLETLPTPLSPLGLRLTKRQPIFTSPWFSEGLFEMQDEGSQIAAWLVDAAAGMRVIDFCAGAGGKTLAIAAQMHNKGRILALDTSAKRLKELPLRMRRAGVNNVQWHTLTSEQDSFLKRHKKTADRVLVDAPCSGTGTWRRNPDLKWRLTPQDIIELTRLQQSILTSAARLVKPGGRLIYVTCSLLKKENEDQVDTFLKAHTHFRVVCAKKIWDKESANTSNEAPSYLSLSPGQDGTDGFFAAVVERFA